MFGVISDMHYHNFSLFDRVTPEGISWRLENTIEATHQAVNELRAWGGKRLYCAGDTFHVRGTLKPSVLNPVIDLYSQIIKSGIEVRMLAGNHDLETQDADDLGSAIQALQGVGVETVNEPRIYEDDKVAMLPWYKSQDETLKRAQALASEIAQSLHDLSEWTLILHAPLNGVIKGLPDTGIDPEQLEMGWGLVLCGHYHNHKKLTDKVYSIGALTHQTWGDVGSKAGYLLVNSSLKVEQHETGAPQFKDFDPNQPDQVEGHFARVRLGEATEAEIIEIRDAVLTDYGAIGCVVQATPAPKGVARSTQVKTSGVTILESARDWLSAYEPAKGLDQQRLLKLADEVLTSSRTGAGA